MSTWWVSKGTSARGKIIWAPRYRAQEIPDGFAVYRVYGTGRGRPLYIGSTGDLLRRIEDHKRRSTWWSDATKLAVDYYPDSTRAFVEEYAAIRKYRPIHNVEGNKPRRPLDAWVTKLAEEGWPPAVAAIGAMFVTEPASEEAAAT